MNAHPTNFDVFLSYPHTEGVWVENLAKRLEDEAQLNVWLDKWILVPGQPFQPGMAQGIEVQSKSCAVCIGESTPKGWVHEELQKALSRQVRDPSFRVIPVLLPNAHSANVNDFLELRTWVDFRISDQAYAFHLLVCGIKGIPPGRWPPK